MKKTSWTTNTFVNAAVYMGVFDRIPSL